MTLSDLERLAREATPGPWRAEGLGIYGREDMRQVKAGRTQVARTYRSENEPIAALSGTLGRYEREAVNAAFIAACDPDTVLALLRVVRAAVALEKADIANADLAPGTPIDEFRDALAALNLKDET